MSPTLHVPLDPSHEAYLTHEADAMTLRVHAATVGDTGPFLRERRDLAEATRAIRLSSRCVPVVLRFPHPNPAANLWFQD